MVEQSESVRPFNTVGLISYLNKFKGCFDIICSFVWTHSLLTFFITYHYPQSEYENNENGLKCKLYFKTATISLLKLHKWSIRYKNNYRSYLCLSLKKSKITDHRSCLTLKACKRKLIANIGTIKSFHLNYETVFIRSLVIYLNENICTITL